MDSLTFYLPIVLLITFALFLRVRATRRNPSLPPGPPADPLIGHARMIPRQGQGELYHQWGKKYGDVIYLSIFGQPVIVLNSVRAAIDLLDKRSVKYSDRPRFVMFVDILGAYPALSFLEYGKRFHKHRRLFHSLFSRDQCYAFEKIQTVEARVLVKSLVASPESFRFLVRRFATALVIKIAYGHQILSDDDRYIKVAERFSHAVNTAGRPIGTPPDFLPFLRHLPAWFPGAWWSRHGRDWRQAVRDIFEVPFEDVRKQLANGDIVQPSFVATHLETLAQGVASEEDIEDIKGAAGTIFAGGMETTWATIITFILAMTLYPEKQRKAQEEIDAIVGHDRLPEFSDRHALPYVEGLLQEVLRWYPAGPLGLPHRVTEDDTYRGMFIPKGSIVIGNALSMSLDETVYAEPHKFSPERFLPKPAGNEEPYPIASFGFGRRVCPGRYLAETSVWIVIATVLAVFNIGKARGEDGEEIVPEVSFMNGLTSQPKEFKCVISPRSNKAELLVMQATASVAR